MHCGMQCEGTREIALTIEPAGPAIGATGASVTSASPGQDEIDTAPVELGSWCIGMRVRYRQERGTILRFEWGIVDVALDGGDVVRVRLIWRPDLKAVSNSAHRPRRALWTEKGRCAM